MFINNFNNNYNVNRHSFKGNDEVRFKDLYANDIHGILNGYNRLITVADKFESERKAEPNVIRSTYLSGDGIVGANRMKNKLVMRLENFVNPRAKTPGNHDFDDYGTKGLAELLEESNVPTLALNMVIKPGSGLQKFVDSGKLRKSMICEENGVKFALIGLIPSDMSQRLNQQCKDNSKDIDILNLPDTIKAVQAEVQRLENEEGIKIIKIVSHMGNMADVAIAKTVNGIDIIHGAHSHDLIKGIEPGKNYFTSKRGEPVLITQAGKNGHWYGVSDVIFDKNTGIIKNASNNVYSLDNVSSSLKATTIEQMMLGQPKKIGEMIHDTKTMPEALLGENPMSSFLCDGYKKLTGADIVFNNAGTVRSSIKKGDITDRMIVDMMPFYNSISTYKLSEKDVVDAINGGLDAMKKVNRTGALQVAGMSYVISKDGKVKEANLLKDDGTKEKIDVENPRSDKFFTVAYNTFLSGGTDGVELLKAPDKLIKTFDQNETDLLVEYIKSFNGKPISIDCDGRITQEQ